MATYTDEVREIILEVAREYRGYSTKTNTFREYLAREVSYRMEGVTYNPDDLYKEYKGLLVYGPDASSYEEYYYNEFGEYPEQEFETEEIENHKKLRNAYLENIDCVEKDAEKQQIEFVFLSFTRVIKGLENLKLNKIGKEGLYVGYFYDNNHMSSVLSYIEESEYERYLVVPFN